MSDTDALDMEDGEAPEGGASSKKKKGGLGALLPTLLKFAAIGIGALLFIVTVSVITYNIMNSGGKAQTNVTDPLSPYIGRKPVFDWYTDIGTVTTKTRDDPEKAHTVSVVMNLGYDSKNTDPDVNTATYSELSGRKYELQDFVRRYFAQKYADELKPENEERLKQDIKEQLNKRLLDKGRVRDITFTKFDVMEAF
jgi:flagellar FliL protein